MPFVDRAGARIHYRDEGIGPPLVLHTGGAGDGTMWDAAGYAERLHGHRRLVLDHRGRGLSDPVAAVTGHTREAYVSDVIAVADAAGADRFMFAGYSMGAGVGYRLAAAHPDRVMGLVAIGGAADEPGTPDDPAQFVLSLRAWAREGDTTWDDLAAIACPVALVAGEQEAPPGSLERMAAAIPRGAVVGRLAGLGHVGAFLQPEAVLALAQPVLAAGREPAPR